MDKTNMLPWRKVAEELPEINKETKQSGAVWVTDGECMVLDRMEAAAGE